MTVRRSIPIIRHLDFAAEKTIQKSKIADREPNTDKPPDQPDARAIGSGLGVLNREAVARIRASGKQDGLEREGRPGKSADDISAQCEECSPIFLTGTTEWQRDQRAEHQRRD
jgi:hypothetical protein